MCVYKVPIRKIKDQKKNEYTLGKRKFLWRMGAVRRGEGREWGGPSSMVTWMSKVEHGEVCLRKEVEPGWRRACAGSQGEAVGKGDRSPGKR